MAPGTTSWLWSAVFVYALLAGSILHSASAEEEVSKPQNATEGGAELAAAKVSTAVVGGEVSLPLAAAKGAMLAATVEGDEPKLVGPAPQETDASPAASMKSGPAARPTSQQEETKLGSANATDIVADSHTNSTANHVVNATSSGNHEANATSNTTGENKVTKANTELITEEKVLASHALSGVLNGSGLPTVASATVAATVANQGVSQRQDSKEEADPNETDMQSQSHETLISEEPASTSTAPKWCTLLAAAFVFSGVAFVAMLAPTGWRRKIRSKCDMDAADFPELDLDLEDVWPDQQEPVRRKRFKDC